MPQQSVDLSPGEVWTKVSVGMGAEEGPAARSGDDLDARYAQAHRRYHTGRHIRAVITDAGELATRLHLDPDEFDLLMAAVCAHDVVYDARPGEDERASADWAVRALAGAGVHPGVAQRVGELVLMTIAHEAPSGDHVADALLDADLAILAAPSDAYDRYVADVRSEYGRVADDEWRIGRTAVLRGLVDRPAIFRSSRGRALWEDGARANVSAELGRLTNSVQPR